MKKESLEEIFEQLQGGFDLQEPKAGHQERFLEKLHSSRGRSSRSGSGSWWKSLSIAASVVLLLSLGIGIGRNSSNSIEEQVAEISPEVSETTFYFANLVEEQVKELQAIDNPEAQPLIEDTLEQLQKLEADYKNLEQDLIEGGNPKLILSAMITNFQTRIDLLRDVMSRIEEVKQFKNETNEAIIT